MADGAAVGGVVVRVSRSERHNLGDEDREEQEESQRPGA